VIEVDAGREIDVVITKGVRIDVPMAAGADRASRCRRPPYDRYQEASDDGNY
jgi:conjugal transfer pilus assembly protein TraB